MAGTHCNHYSFGVLLMAVYNTRVGGELLVSINNTPLEEHFSEKLEELREGKNMTREQLAEQVGLTARHSLLFPPSSGTYGTRADNC